MLKKIEDEENKDQIKQVQAQHQKKQVNPREEFVQKKLKPYLEVISREGSNRTKTIPERVFGFPPVDLRENDALRNNNLAIFDENMDIVSEVFPNGN